MCWGIMNDREGSHFGEITFGESAPESVEQRIKKLNDLKTQNLISQEEYQHKRADILNEL